ncbi:non-ribosomal peptide synthetase [Brevibacillus parabrevis]|uniref:non-ribosomal peptide synthetase n=1 Tax=Brevibacillus parabrevis TaxID=54914 RepID=UPI002E204E06|nr:non-ribosomal peptide synthetase [Brevibacillus parabrevis]MED2253694.1 amino acid adenylation domain-containing protein [Brevibacillus parabrevis]
MMEESPDMEQITYYPLTHPQKRIWSIEQIYPDTPLHNIGGTVMIKGTVQMPALEKAIHLLMEKHEALRLRVLNRSGEPQQYVSPFAPFPLDYIDFSTGKEPRKDFADWVQAEARKPFVIENERLFYFALFRISDEEHGYLVKLHHMIADGWSINIMTEHIREHYGKLVRGEEVSDHQSAPSYLAYIDHERDYLSSERFWKNRTFWNEKFRDLPDAYVEKSSDTLPGNRITHEWSAELSNQVKEWAKANNWSLNTIFVALYLLYVHKFTGREDLVIGTPVLNRSGKQQKSMFGMFTSTMPFRFTIDDRCSVADMVARVNRELLDCFFHQRYPYDLLIQDVELKKRGYHQLFDVCINYYNTALQTDWDGCAVENVEFYSGHQIYSMQLVIKEWSDSGRISISFDYKTSDYAEEQIEDLFARLTALTRKIVARPDEPIKQLTLFSEEEQQKLVVEYNRTDAFYPRGQTIYQLFEAQAAKTPDKLAVQYGEKFLTYQQLNEKANQLARYLKEQGVGRETIVGLLTTHSLETVIGLIAVGKAGGAFMPIDPDNPAERTRYLLQNSGTQLLLTNVDPADEWGFTGQIIRLPDVDCTAYASTNLQAESAPADMVYMIYTSGSTGRPKGTMVEHRGLVNYICWAKKMYVKQDDEVFPLYSSLAFDLTITSVFTPLISGGTIMVYSHTEDEYVLFRILRENKATIVKLTPSHLSLLTDRDNRNSSVKRFIVGGENLKVSLAKSVYDSFGGNIEILNEYGPTETVVGCMIHAFDPVTDTRAAVPIGKPADNVRIYVLDKQLAPVPTYAVGEMYIAGDGVARGYFRNEELTREKFIDDPFVPGERMYKTGDLGRFLPDGKLEYLGRGDQQVKIRGYRVELGEIENQLLQHPLVKKAVVLDREDKQQTVMLCAYYVAAGEIASFELKQHLARQLPDYLVPHHFIEVKEIPLTANGKVDTRSLAEIELPSTEHIEYDAYSSEKEKQFIQTVEEVLGVRQIGRKHNFYHMGGDSIKAIQIASKLSGKGYQIKVKEMLSTPIMEEMAMLVEEVQLTVVEQGLAEGSILPTPIVAWFFARSFPSPQHYHQTVFVEISPAITVEMLERALFKLVEHHDSLRMNVRAAHGDLFYNNDHLLAPFPIEQREFTDIAHSERYDRLEQVAHELAERTDLSRDLLLKACLIHLGSTRHLLLSAHHLLVDGVSWRIILEDLNALLKQICLGQAVELPLKTHSYQKWAESLAGYWRSEREAGAEKEKAYWEAVLQKFVPFPTDHDGGADSVAASCTLSAELGRQETLALLTEANASYNTEPVDLLLTALFIAIREHTGRTDIVIETEGHGREQLAEKLDIGRTVGWFTSLYPFGLSLTDGALSEQIKHVKETRRNVPNNGIGYGILRYLAKTVPDYAPQTVRFNYLGEFAQTFDGGYVKLLGGAFQQNTSPDNPLTCLIDVNCFVLDGQLQIRLAFSRNKFTESSMQRFLGNFQRHLGEIILHGSQHGAKEFTPSDFDTVELTQEELDNLFI